MEKRFVYADNAATTPITPAVLAAMMPYLTEHYGNPSSLYGIGRQARAAVEKAREQVANALGCLPREIYFVGCGTEADNWALRGAAAMGAKKGKNKIITSCFEHHAILHTCRALERQGFEIVYLPVTDQGLVEPAALEAAIDDKTALVSIMMANNEIGTVQPVEELASICKAHGVFFHTDAVQAVGHLPIHLAESNIDMLSLSGHKLHAPKGIGALYIRKGIVLPNLLEGGAQERNKRGGTENVAGIVGLGEAITLATQNMQQNEEKVRALRDELINGLLQISHSRLNGHPTRRLAGNVNISFEGIEGESLLLLLDMNGVAASSGSACTSGSLDPSHVLLSIGLVHEVAHGSLRLSLSEQNTKEDVAHILSVVPGIVERLRAMSPLWESILAKEAEQERK